MIHHAADVLTEAGIRPSFNMIFGYPGEGGAEQRESFELVMDVCRNYPGAEFWTNIFTPYPGSPVMQRAFELGIEVPRKPRRVGGLLPALHHAAVAERAKNTSGSDNARVSARGDSTAFRSVDSTKHPLARLLHGLDRRAGALASRPRFLRIPRRTVAEKHRRPMFPAPKPKVDAQQLSAEAVDMLILLTHANHLYLGPQAGSRRCSRIRRCKPSIAAALLRGAGHRGRVLRHDLRPRHPPVIDACEPDVVAVCEDNFNFLTKMCLLENRELAL